MPKAVAKKHAKVQSKGYLHRIVRGLRQYPIEVMLRGLPSKLPKQIKK
jgi:hypothetical protein